MRPFRNASLCLALLCLPAAADLFNHKIVLVGDKGAALGGAFTGLADDATATYYNPAGLTQIKNIKLNVSAQVVQYQKQKIGIADGTDIPYNSFNFSPTITAFSQRMGNWAYGFSIVTPQNDLFTGEQKIEGAYRDTESNKPCYESEDNPAPCYTKLNLSYYDVSKTTMIGPSGALKFSDNISLGFTLYAIYYTELEKTAYGGWDANFVGGDKEDMSRFHESSVTRQVNQTGLGGTGMFGILVRMSQGFSFGVNASPGSLVWVTRTEEQRVLEIKNDSLSQPGQTQPIRTKADIVYSLAGEEKHTETSAPSLSLGVSWKPVEPLMLTAQTDYYLGSSYAYTGFTPEDGLERSGFESFTPVEKRYTIRKADVVDFSGGMEWKVMKGYSIAMGGYTDFSQGPDDDRPASWDRNIDYYGGTLSLGMDKDLTESRFGFGMAYGDAAMTHFKWIKTGGGQPVLQQNPATGGVARIRQNFKAYTFGIFLSSTLKI
ncbi:MAG: rane protein involved in aromatic hydrocarbon degradation [Fibrobacteres bacterium]|nr:rane protein involved in aromatic hydrocarbon degradation [Fibrobacterota bacterium]